MKSYFVKLSSVGNKCFILQTIYFFKNIASIRPVELFIWHLCLTVHLLVLYLSLRFGFPDNLYYSLLFSFWLTLLILNTLHPSPSSSSSEPRTHVFASHVNSLIYNLPVCKYAQSCNYLRFNKHYFIFVLSYYPELQIPDSPSLTTGFLKRFSQIA